jgi:hypothetical protein
MLLLRLQAVRALQARLGRHGYKDTDKASAVSVLEPKYRLSMITGVLVLERRSRAPSIAFPRQTAVSEDFPSRSGGNGR